MREIIAFFSTVRAKDVVDILIVAVIIYQFLIAVRGTRAVQMLLGILGLAVLYWVSVSYELFSLHWILRNFFSSILIIFLIVFQDQIRSALVSFGGTRIFRRNSLKDVEADIEEIVEVAGVMGREKIGALIVFERTTGLANYIRTGTTLNCRIHSDIIYAIFQSSSPLHDGAVIVSTSVLKAAGCFLPLSKNVEIDRHLGTRHRAALGISEQSDALVLIVSEETGQINLVLNGMFYPMKDASNLRRQMKKLLVENVKSLSKNLAEVKE
jgi:diadenylate cyclase